MVVNWQVVRAAVSRVDPQDVGSIFARLQRRAREAYVPPGPFSGLRRWASVIAEALQRIGSDRLILVQDLMQSVPLSEHVANADAYFADMGWHRRDARKPFADPLEAEALLRSLTVLIPHLELSGAKRLLDFGAGTCWSSIIWAALGCEVIASDVSANALRFGEERVRADPIARDLPISFLRFDGQRLALPDTYVDRIVGIETLHHVLDIEATLRECARVLAPGGIVAFSEPGPLHSLSPQSQFEMAEHRVIENDIRVEEIERMARAAGFSDMRVAWFSPVVQLLSPRDFNRRIRRNATAREAKAFCAETNGRLANTRIFLLYKEGSRPLTSAGRTGLAATLAVDLRRDAGRLMGTLTACNVGRATWLPSGTGVGDVNVGIHRHYPDGERETHFAHVPLSAVAVRPGESAVAPIDIPLPSPGGSITIDLVSEGVAWFSTVGGAPVTVNLEEI